MSNDDSYPDDYDADSLPCGCCSCCGCTCYEEPCPECGPYSCNCNCDEDEDE